MVHVMGMYQKDASRLYQNDNTNKLTWSTTILTFTHWELFAAMQMLIKSSGGKAKVLDQAYVSHELGRRELTDLIALVWERNVLTKAVLWWRVWGGLWIE